MEISTIGLDLAKNVFEVHGVNATGEVVLRKTLRRAQMLPFFAKLRPCLVGAEACGTSHHWARELTQLGHEVRLMPASYVKPYSAFAEAQLELADAQSAPDGSRCFSAMSVNTKVKKRPVRENGRTSEPLRSRFAVFDGGG